MKKKIGIIGSGMVAKALGNGFLKYGYQVMLGSRDTSKLDEWINSDGRGAAAGSFKEVSEFGDIIVLAVAGRIAKEALDLAEISNLDGKTIIDATNPISEAPPVNGVLKFFTNLDESLLEHLQEYVPGANFVKAFNSIGSAFMVDPDFEMKPTMFICGDDENAKKETTEILDEFGWETWDMGTKEAARAIEPLCMLWCIPGFKDNQWSQAFKLMKK